MNKNNPVRAFLKLFFWSCLILFGLTLMVGRAPVSEPVQNITVTELYKALNDGKIKSLAVNVEESVVTGEMNDSTKFRSTVFDANDLVEKAVAKGIPVTREKAKESWVGWSILWMLFFLFAPVILLIGGIFWLNRRQMRMASDLAKRKEQAERSKTKFADVAGCDEAVEEMRRVKNALESPERFAKQNIVPTRGVLLIGPPGTGKTLLAQALAGECNANFIKTSGSDFVEIFVGMGARHVREVFETARKNQPCIVFIDELDAVASRRTMALTHEEYTQTLDQLLSEMSGFSTSDRVVVVGATNRPEALDPAILRPGRFDLKIVVPLPDVVGREKILEIHARGKKFAADVDFKRVARGTSGLSGADLAAILNQAAISVVEDEREEINQADINDAIDKVMLGPARKQVMSTAEKVTTAYHEGGHALVTTLLRKRGSHPVRKVTIIPRGPTGGATWMMPDEDVHIHSKDMLVAQMAVMMGGRAAEMHKFRVETSGAAGDFKQATKAARAMICEYGMSDKIGKEVFVESANFLGIKSDQMSCSEATKQLIDAEVKRLLDESYALACKLIEEHSDKLEQIAQALLERETLDGREVEAIVDAP